MRTGPVSPMPSGTVEKPSVGAILLAPGNALFARRGNAHDGPKDASNVGRPGAGPQRLTDHTGMKGT